MCNRDYSGYEIVLSGFFGSVGVWPYHEVTPEMERKTREVIDLLEIAHLADRPTNEMSSGEARRILIGRALVHDPQALVLDEPTTSLDLRATYELREILRKLTRRGISSPMVTHHLPDIIPEIGRVVLMPGGKVYRDGKKQEVCGQMPLAELFGVPVEVWSVADTITSCSRRCTPMHADRTRRRKKSVHRRASACICGQFMPFLLAP